jgi:hypothetical protein
VKRYVGRRRPTQRVEVEVYEADEARPLRARRRHSLEGVDWGPLASCEAAADLALSLLWDALGHEPALRVYRRFAAGYVPTLPASWEISETQLRRMIGSAADGPLRRRGGRRRSRIV